MTIKVAIGRKEGFISSVGFMVNGLAFMCRGETMDGLHWEPAETRHKAIRELRFILEYLKSAGVVVEGIEKLDEERT